MTNERVLARVEADLAQGHTYVAIQRLTTLVQTDPTDLDARARLAEVHATTGNLVEAGRWSYLVEAPDYRAISAFEHANPHPRSRLHTLRWGGDHAGLGPRARARLTTLEDDASSSPQQSIWGEPLFHAEPGRFDVAGPVAVVIGVSLLIGLAAIVFVVGLVASVNAIF